MTQKKEKILENFVHAKEDKGCNAKAYHFVDKKIRE